MEEFFSGLHLQGQSLSVQDREKHEYLVERVIPTVAGALSALLRKQEEVDTAKHKMNKGQKVNPYRFIAEYLYRHHPEKTDVEYQSREHLNFIAAMQGSKSQVLS